MQWIRAISYSWIHVMKKKTLTKMKTLAKNKKRRKEFVEDPFLPCCNAHKKMRKKTKSSFCLLLG